MLLGVLLGLKLAADVLLGAGKKHRRRPFGRDRSRPSSGQHRFAAVSSAVPTPPDLPVSKPLMSDIEVVCSSCKAELIAPSDMAGQEATCEVCNAVVVVPSSLRKIVSPPLIAVPVRQRITIKLLRELEWKRFEQVTEAYFARAGWRTKPARIGPDGGVDIHLFRPNENAVAAVVQCKAWHAWKVGVKPVRELFGVMAAESVCEGFFVAAGDYTGDAEAFARGKALRLIRGRDLVDRIERLSASDQYQIFKIATTGDFRTPTCPRCGEKMIRRITKKGRNMGDSFWGCRNYPHCRQILHMRNSGDISLS